MFRRLRVHQIFASSTEIGKTVFSTLLCRASLAAGENVAYVKPIGTTEPGALGDAEFVSRFAGSDALKTSCLFHFDQPVSPHLAAQRSQLSVPSDEDFAGAIRQHLTRLAAHNNAENASAYVESAGGVHSPVLSGSSQLDAYRPLRLPTILIASHALGGISGTISAYESLLLRGYEIDAVLCFEEEYYRNYEYLRRFFEEREIFFDSCERPPAKLADCAADHHALDAYFKRTLLEPAVRVLQDRHVQRIDSLETAGCRTLESVWWPFVQHTHVKSPDEVMVIDSADGDYFRVKTQEASETLLEPVLDGSASWWSQGFGHANHEIALAAANAAGRYGHVMFPVATHAPALRLAERLVHSAGKGWASRCFYSDDGSTAIEVALKMALRLHNVRTGTQQRRPLGVLGIAGSYHGDTIGAMDASPGNVYNERVDWYQGRGFWLDPPVLVFKDSQVHIKCEGAQWHSSPEQTFHSIADAYAIEDRLKTDPLAHLYERHIRALLSRAHIELGALIIEPVVMGAAGMCFVDPLFQRILVDVARSDLGLPVIFDEVFSGMGRLGFYSAGPSMLGVNPDIAAYAKILSGGLVPLSATLASNEVFEAFQGAAKVDALLHGHSYTAHPVGCAVANKALDILERHGIGTGLPSKWSIAFLRRLSEHPELEGVMSLGTVLAIYLKTQDAGYQSSAAAALLERLRSPDTTLQHPAIHARPLGNVVYIITSITTPGQVVGAYEAALQGALAVLMPS